MMGCDDIAREVPKIWGAVDQIIAVCNLNRNCKDANRVCYGYLGCNGRRV